MPNPRHNIRRALFAAVLLASRADAATSYTWTAGPSETHWSTPANWTPASVPSATDTAYVIASNQNIVIDLDVDYPAASPLNRLVLQTSTAGTIVLNQTSHEFYVTSSQKPALDFSSSNNASIIYNLSGGTLTSTAQSIYTISLFGNPGGPCAINLSGENTLLNSWGEDIESNSSITQTGGKNLFQTMHLGENGTNNLYKLVAGFASGNTVAAFNGTFAHSGGTLALTGSVTVSSAPFQNASYLLTGGSLTAGTVSVRPGGTFSQSGGNLSALAFTQIGGSATLGGSQSLYTFPTFSITGGAVTVSTDASKLLVAGSLTLGGTHSLDLTTNDLLLHSTAGSLNSTLATIKSYLITNKLFSSSTSPTTTLALMKSADYLTLHPGATFSNQTLTQTDLLIKYTYYGDADLSGNVTLNDYSLIEAGFLLGNFDPVNNPASWVNGDFNYDGKVDFADYALIDYAFQQQPGNLAMDEITQHAAQFGAPYLTALQSLSSIPEPNSLALLSVCIIPLLRRKRTP